LGTQEPRESAERFEMPHEWRVFVTGVTSIHGWPIFQRLRSLVTSDRLFALRPPKMNVPEGPNVVSMCITDVDGLHRIREEFRPTHVVHCGGVCDLDVCEERPKWAAALNTEGAENLARVFGGDCYVMYLSSDLVFSGNDTPAGGYREEDVVSPVSVVGKTIAAGEEDIRRCRRHCMVLLGLPLGPSITGGKGAVDWIGSRFRRNLKVTLFRDEFRSCIDCGELASAVVRLLVAEAEGLYHLGGRERLSLFGVGAKIIADGDHSTRLLKGIMRKDEVDGPPRVGDISLNSSKINGLLTRLHERCEVEGGRWQWEKLKPTGQGRCSLSCPILSEIRSVETNPFETDIVE
jgi:dTDP-4-dehydrorhamnose reductase